MALSPEEREQLLADLPENIRQAVALRMPEVHTLDDFNALKAAEELELVLRPLAEQSQAGDDAAFGSLWEIVKPKLRGAVRASLRYRGEDHFDEVQLRVMIVLWKPPKPYEPGPGRYYLTWARGIAHNAARWYRPGIAREDELTDVHGLLPASDLPPSAGYREVLKLAQNKEPHIFAAFVFNKYLGWTPKDIVAQLGELTLPQVLDRLEHEVVSQYPDMRGFGFLLEPVRQSVESGGRTFSSFFPDKLEPEAAISRWAGDTLRAVSGMVIGQEGPLLALACGLKAPSYERLSFLWCRFLRGTPFSMAALRDLLVMKVFERFCAGYLSVTDLAEKELAVLVLPLREQIFPAQFLWECERQDLTVDIARWRDRVQALLLAAARAGQLVAYAYLCGCLPGLAGPARNIKKKQGGSNDAVRKSSAHG